MARTEGLIAALLLSFLVAIQALGAPGGEDLEKPRNSGVLLLSRGWHYGPWDNEAIEEGQLDLDRLPRDLGRLVIRQRNIDLAKGKARCDRRLFKHFRLPANWKDRPVWFTYETRHFSVAGIAEVWLNGHRLDIAVPTRMGKTAVITVPGDAADAMPESNWFCDISKFCKVGEENTITFRVQQWPLMATTGVWMFSPPEKERVLFLISPDQTAANAAALKRYVDNVQRLFPVEAITVNRQFATSEDLRAFLKMQHEENGIGGVVLIGTHPISTVKLPNLPGPSAISPYYGKSLPLAASRLSRTLLFRRSSPCCNRASDASGLTHRSSP